MKNHDKKNPNPNNPKLIKKIPSKMIEAISSLDLEYLPKSASCSASLNFLGISNKLNPEINSQKDKNYIIGNYLIKRTLGEGTFGKVKLGINLQNGEKVAIKIHDKEKIIEEDEEIRVKREFEMLAKFNHINVISVAEIFESISKYYIVMDYCEGGELFNYIVKKRKLSSNEAAFFYYQLINGLDYIHSLGIVHRDLKPENLLLTKNHILKIVDFGLSNYFKKNQKELLITPCGSPCYASPEMVSGKKYDGFKIDIWSSGIILYVMLCGYLPFEDRNNENLFRKILECKLELPKFINDDAKDLIKKILVLDPCLRISIPEIKKHNFFLKGKEIYEKKFKINNVKNEVNNLNKDKNKRIKKSDINIKSLELCFNNERKTIFEDNDDSLYNNKYLNSDNDGNNKCKMIKEILNKLNNDYSLFINKKNESCQMKVINNSIDKKNKKINSVVKKLPSDKNPKLKKIQNIRLINFCSTKEKNKNLTIGKKDIQKNKIKNIINHYTTYNISDKNNVYNYDDLVKNRLINYKNNIKEKLKNRRIINSDKKDYIKNNITNIKFKKININGPKKFSKQITQRENYSNSKYKSNSISVDKYEKNYFLNLFSHNTSIKRIKKQNGNNKNRKKKLTEIEINCDNNHIYNVDREKKSRSITEAKNNKKLIRNSNKSKHNIMNIKLVNKLKNVDNVNMSIMVNSNKKGKNVIRFKKDKLKLINLKSNEKKLENKKNETNNDTIRVHKKDISINKLNDKVGNIKINNSPNKNLNIYEELQNNLNFTNTKTESFQANKNMKNNKNKNNISQNKTHSHTVSEQYSKTLQLLNYSSYLSNIKFKNPFYNQDQNLTNNPFISHKNNKKKLNLKNINRFSPHTKITFTATKNNEFGLNTFDLLLETINKNERSATIEQNLYGKHRLSNLCNEYQITMSNYINNKENLFSVRTNNKILNNNNTLDTNGNKRVFFCRKKSRKIISYTESINDKNSNIISKNRIKQVKKQQNLTNTNANTNKPTKKKNKPILYDKGHIKYNSLKIDDFSLYEIRKFK